MLVFSAGAEFSPSIHAAMLTYAERALLTSYPFITGTSSMKVVRYLLDGFGDRTLIMDSGIHSLRGVTPRFTDGWLKDYFKKYVRFLKESRFNGIIVEFDIHQFVPNWQKLLVEFRKQLNGEFGDRALFVCHPWSGMNDLLELVETRRRIAIPALRRLSASRVNPENSYRIFMKPVDSEVAKTKHFHILGETSTFAMTLPDNYSCDSTTWSMIVRFGRAFPRTPFGVFWWRRDKLEVPKPVQDVVDAKLKELYSNYWKSPEASRNNPQPKYTYALASALVASQLYASSAQVKIHNPEGMIPITEGLEVYHARSKEANQERRRGTGLRKPKGA